MPRAALCGRRRLLYSKPGIRFAISILQKAATAMTVRQQDTAWKHHPWDSTAAGQAASCSGVHTYVFKRGASLPRYVERPGVRSARQSDQVDLRSFMGRGRGGHLRFCKDHRRLEKGAEHRDIPNKSKVWYTDLDFAPRNVWMVSGEEITRIPLARMPNWTVSDPEDVKKEWWFWDNPGHPYFHLTMKSERRSQRAGHGEGHQAHHRAQGSLHGSDHLGRIRLGRRHTLSLLRAGL